jgi:hypothetical protein
MADSISVSGPVQLRNDTRERVAFELTELIARSETNQH